MVKYEWVNFIMFKELKNNMRDDNGLSLIEIVVYMIISALFSLVLFTLFMAVSNAFSQIKNNDTVANKSQVISQYINNSLHNGDPNGTVILDLPGDRQSVVSRVNVDGLWRCEAWVYTSEVTVDDSEGIGKVFFKSTPNPIVFPSDFDDDVTWRKIGDNVDPLLNNGNSFFEFNGNLLSYSFKVNDGVASASIINSVIVDNVGDSTLDCVG